MAFLRHRKSTCSILDALIHSAVSCSTPMIATPGKRPHCPAEQGLASLQNIQLRVPHLSLWGSVQCRIIVSVELISPQAYLKHSCLPCTLTTTTHHPMAPWSAPPNSICVMARIQVVLRIALCVVPFFFCLGERRGMRHAPLCPSFGFCSACYVLYDDHSGILDSRTCHSIDLQYVRWCTRSACITKKISACRCSPRPGVSAKAEQTRGPGPFKSSIGGSPRGFESPRRMQATDRAAALQSTSAIRSPEYVHETRQ